MRNALKSRVVKVGLGVSLLGFLPLIGCGQSKPETGTVVKDTQAELDAWKAEAQAPTVGDRPVKGLKKEK
jgi:hypothetical protein